MKSLSEYKLKYPKVYNTLNFLIFVAPLIEVVLNMVDIFTGPTVKNLSLFNLLRSLF